VTREASEGSTPQAVTTHGGSAGGTRTVSEWSLVSASELPGNRQGARAA
jgi:hypothetical protein